MTKKKGIASMTVIRTVLSCLILFACSTATNAEPIFRAVRNPLLGIWQAPPVEWWVGFDWLAFGPTSMRAEGMGTIRVRNYRLTEQHALVVTDDGETFAFEIMGRDRICLFPASLQLLSRPSWKLDHDRRCYARRCWAPPTIMPTSPVPVPGCAR
jgi:hypothetical protein